MLLMFEGSKAPIQASAYIARIRKYGKYISVGHVAACLGQKLRLKQ
jgi:hypothetical protein